MVQCYTLHNPQCLDELRRDGFGLVLFALYIREEERLITASVRKLDQNKFKLTIQI